MAFIEDEELMRSREARLRRKLENLGFDEPKCLFCGEDDPFCLELDHIAGRAHDETVWPLCRNCHARRTHLQKDHPPKGPDLRQEDEQLGRFLLGLADFFEMLIEKLRAWGSELIAKAASLST
jgi:5-methylcytosine-specific restriction endonuclease McrA